VQAGPADPIALIGEGPLTWRSWVAGVLVDRPEDRTFGWRRTLTGLPDADAVFVAAEDRVTELLASCPERRDLVHGDLLHRNVLISPDGSQATGVFSWKCAARGDFLYDVAWCTFWSPWHPGIAAADAWQLTVTASDLTSADLVHAPARHHCYELAIGASHLGWYLWTGDHRELERATARLAELLRRGPMPDL
jgi:aminoglycoside phosphotransferase (APT) family kinase protein